MIPNKTEIWILKNKHSLFDYCYGMINHTKMETGFQGGIPLNTNSGFSNKGILNADAGMQKFNLTRHLPAEDLAFFIQRYWIVEWDLRGQEPYDQTVISHPNVNMVFERNLTRAYGISRSTSTQRLQDQGKVFGIKFRPGGFYPLWQSSVSELTDRSVGFQELFGFDGHALEEEILAQPDADAMIRIAENFFRERFTAERDDQIELAGQIVDTIMNDRSIMKVDDIVRIAGMNKRTMQRLFSRYVGISPKWVIQRYRLHEAAELVEQGGVPEWSRLSLELGYYDQAHFIKVFKAIVGYPPKGYLKEIGI